MTKDQMKGEFKKYKHLLRTVKARGLEMYGWKFVSRDGKKTLSDRAPGFSTVELAKADAEKALLPLLLLGEEEGHAEVVNNWSMELDKKHLEDLENLRKGIEEVKAERKADMKRSYAKGYSKGRSKGRQYAVERHEEIVRNSFESGVTEGKIVARKELEDFRKTIDGRLSDARGQGYDEGYKHGYDKGFRDCDERKVVEDLFDDDNKLGSKRKLNDGDPRNDALVLAQQHADKKLAQATNQAYHEGYEIGLSRGKHWGDTGEMPAPEAHIKTHVELLREDHAKELKKADYKRLEENASLTKEHAEELKTLRENYAKDIKKSRQAFVDRLNEKAEEHADAIELWRKANERQTEQLDAFESTIVSQRLWIVLSFVFGLLLGGIVIPGLMS